MRHFPTLEYSSQGELIFFKNGLVASVITETKEGRHFQHLEIEESSQRARGGVGGEETEERIQRGGIRGEESRVEETEWRRQRRGDRGEETEEGSQRPRGGVRGGETEGR